MYYKTYLAIFTLLTTINAYPGGSTRFGEVFTEIKARQSIDGSQDSKELIGDLRPEFGGPTTVVGHNMADILTGSADPESSGLWTGGLSNPGSAKCQADTCCVWRHIALDMEKVFRGASGRCTAEARGAVRLGFHDAGGWSKYTEDFGGADGSILLSGRAGLEAEIDRAENRGLQLIAGVMNQWYDKYHPYGVGMADLIQMGATVAAVVCPLGPRIRSFVGRADSSRPALQLLPDVHADADTLISLFRNKTINTHGLVALLGAHTTSQQHFVDVSRAGDPQDSTPGIWDVKFYNETMSTAPKRVFKFSSDVVISQHPDARPEWIKFANDQEHWNQDYAREYIRLSLLGVYNINDLTECSHVLPAETTKVTISDNQAALKKWLDGVDNRTISDDVEAGRKVSG
ncbi:heme peroxidase, partial [Aureobasidium melanogenum]